MSGRTVLRVVCSRHDRPIAFVLPVDANLVFRAEGFADRPLDDGVSDWFLAKCRRCDAHVHVERDEIEQAMRFGNRVLPAEPTRGFWVKPSKNYPTS